MNRRSSERSPNSDAFRWIQFREDKLVVFSNGELKAQRKMLRNERIRVIAKSTGDYYFSVTTAMDWKTVLAAGDFTFVVAPNPVIESYPAPFPGVLQDSGGWRGPRWGVPKYFNGVPVIGEKTVIVSSKEKRKPMVRLCLNGGPDKKLFYEVASFVVE